MTAETKKGQRRLGPSGLSKRLILLQDEACSTELDADWTAYN